MIRCCNLLAVTIGTQSDRHQVFSSPTVTPICFPFCAPDLIRNTIGLWDPPALNTQTSGPADSPAVRLYRELQCLLQEEKDERESERERRGRKAEIKASQQTMTDSVMLHVDTIQEREIDLISLHTMSVTLFTLRANTQWHFSFRTSRSSLHHSALN